LEEKETLVDTGRPYKEEGEVRTFLQEVDEFELVWHRDREDRIITPLGKTDWKFQFEDELPINIEGDIFINKNKFHRLIKGTGDIKLRVKKIL
jgi:hypothetical protein